MSEELELELNQNEEEEPVESAADPEILPVTEDKVENLRAFQPNSRVFVQGSGPEAWWSTSYIRKAEMFGAGAAKSSIVDNQSGKV